MGTLLLFFDGVGVGADDPDTNPFARIDARRLGAARGRPPRPGHADDPSGGAAYRPLDPRLGVPGLPQSATGQTTLFTGVNAARYAGRHMQGLPGPTLRPLLERESLFLKLVRAGRQPTFANAYRPGTLQARRPRMSASSLMVRAAGVPFRTLDEHDRRDEALYHDYTGRWGRDNGRPTVLRDAGQAAAVLDRLVESHDLVLYEYFLTDLAAHRGTDEDKTTQARRVEELVDAVLGTLDLARHRVVVVSDHGNLEDSTDRRHTLNPVPLLAWGRGAEALIARVSAMDELTPALVTD